MPWLSCLKSHCRFANQVEEKFVVHWLLFVEFIERRSVTSPHHGSTISGWQLNQLRWPVTEGERQKSDSFLLTKQQIWMIVHHATLFISLPLLHPCDMKLANFSCLLYGVGAWTQHNSCLFLFLNLNTVLLDSTWENFANICQIKWNWIRWMMFEAVWIHFLSDVFSLLSSKNFATMTTWRNDFSLLGGLWTRIS